MFAGIISRDHGCPWPDTGMTSTQWLTVPASEVTIAELTATQPGLLLQALTGEPNPIGGDPTPHVIQWDGNLYLEDGHHRAARAALAGHTSITARVLVIDTP
jgi:hypothetical protein